MDDTEILLRIRREFSKKEKYRFLLRYLNTVENERARERKINTEQMKELAELRQTINDLNNKLTGLQGRYDKIVKKQTGAQEYISFERYQQKCKERNDMERKYVQQVENNIQLQIQIDKLKQNAT